MARARSFGNIRKLPSGRYQARYWHLGKQVAAGSTFASKTDARRWLATVEADMIRGVWVDPDAGRIPFGEYATRWVVERPVRPRTREIYEGQLRHIVTVFDGVHLCDVHPVDVRTWHGRLAASGLHHNTVAKIYHGRRMQFRFGINVGDVIGDESGDIFGDGVNVAARLESIAPPGGIAVSNAVREAVQGKVELEFTDGGEHDLKNIPRPVRVWFAGGSARPDSRIARSASRTVATIAVMPFANMSGDDDQQYFADGITEDLLTALSRDKDLAVIARNSSFAYRATDKDLRSVARELDATHIVEGSVRRAGNRVRVTANLVDAEAGHQLWAERFDGELEDIFTLQDELVDSITARLRPTLFERAARATETKQERAVDAWDLTLRGQHDVNRNTIDGFLAGIDLLDQAHELDPQMADPVGKCAVAWLHLALTGWSREGVNPWASMTERAESAYRLDSNNYEALAAMAAARSYSAAPLEGAEFARRMIDINRHGAFGYHWLGHNVGFAGLRDEAIPVLTDAWRLGRYEPWRHHVATNLAYAHYFNHDYQSALNWARTSAQIADLLQAHIILAAAGAQLGDEHIAEKYGAAILRARPQFSCGRYRRRIPFVQSADQDLLIEGLTLAELPA